LYYLQSRYYDPEVGRFLNADAYTSTGQGILGNNMFAYCGNNPIMRSDPNGEFYAPIRPGKQFFACEVTHTREVRERYFVYTTYEGLWYEQLYEYVFNDDPSRVLKSDHFSFYKGQLVVRGEYPLNRSGSFGIMFLDKDETNTETVQHEWGHFRQLCLMGLSNYSLSVALPSALSDPYNPDYYSNPWERTADYLGGVNRSSGYKEGSFAWGMLQFLIGPISVPLYYIFEK